MSSMWPYTRMKIIDNIKEEHINRAKWIDENLTIRERARIDREVAIKVCIALVFYILVMALLEILI